MNSEVVLNKHFVVDPIVWVFHNWSRVDYCSADDHLYCLAKQNHQCDHYFLHYNYFADRSHYLKLVVHRMTVTNPTVDLNYHETLPPPNYQNYLTVLDNYSMRLMIFRRRDREGIHSG
jgi:hypothetical protein